jgi:hypothetical protein
MKTRNEMVKELEDFYADGYCLDSDWAKSVLRHGWKGFNYMSDEEVKDLYDMEVKGVV